MIISLKMKCWRQHIERTINFTSGLNAILGANEAGKTGAMMAINYTLWGAKAVPMTLEDMVTWGYPVKELKTEVILKVGSELYHFVRSKAGAECNHSGGVVTGQNEVTKFATELLGADADLASKLMFASQKGLTSLLDSGPTALSGYIEDLAGMDLFDRLLDVIQRKLTTGPTTAIDSALATLEAAVEAGLPEQPDVSLFNTEIEGLDADITLQTNGLSAVTILLNEATDALSEAKAKSELRSNVSQSLVRAENLQAQRVAQKATLEAQAAVAVDEARIKTLEANIADETLNQKLVTIYGKFTGMVYPEAFWEGDILSLKAGYNAAYTLATDKTRLKSEIETEMRVTEAKRVTASVCGFCNQDMSKFPDVERMNFEIEEYLSCKRGEVLDFVDQINVAIEERDAYKAVIDSADTFSDFAKQYADYVDADQNVVPWKLTWRGAVPVAGQDVRKLKIELENLNATKRAAALAAGKLEQVVEALAEDETTISTLKEDLSALPSVDNLTTLEVDKSRAQASKDSIQEIIRRLEASIRDIESRKSAVFAAYEVAKRAYNAAVIDKATKSAERDVLLFNNTLVKKVKLARPIVAAKLWSIVLASTSQLFSTMRGEASVVTKGVDAFLVNGKSSKGLSGSALDLLGLALRVSLLKTFIPACSILSLDEPAAASDDNRTMSILGFLAGCEFEQVLLVTHDKASESVADNLVMI